MDLGPRDRSCILVGGTRGIGFETSRILAKEGARLTIIGRERNHVRAQADALEREFGTRVQGLAAHGAEPKQIGEAISASIEAFGAPVGLLASNGSTNCNGSLLEMTDEDWLQNFQDVLMGQIRAIRSALPAMIKRAADGSSRPQPIRPGYPTLRCSAIPR